MTSVRTVLHCQIKTINHDCHGHINSKLGLDVYHEPLYTLGWCYIVSIHEASMKDDTGYIVVGVFSYELWVYMVFTVLPVLYIAAYVYFRCKVYYAHNYMTVLYQIHNLFTIIHR